MKKLAKVILWIVGILAGLFILNMLMTHFIGKSMTMETEEVFQRFFTAQPAQVRDLKGSSVVAGQQGAFVNLSFKADGRVYLRDEDRYQPVPCEGELLNSMSEAQRKSLVCLGMQEGVYTGSLVYDPATGAHTFVFISE